MKRIEEGPRKWTDPYDDFIENDKIEWCRSNCKSQEFKEN